MYVYLDAAQNVVRDVSGIGTDGSGPAMGEHHWAKVRLWSCILLAFLSVQFKFISKSLIPGPAF